MDNTLPLNKINMEKLVLIKQLGETSKRDK
jgi:hypothetical protein